MYTPKHTRYPKLCLKIFILFQNTNFVTQRIDVSLNMYMRKFKKIMNFFSNKSMVKSVQGCFVISDFLKQRNKVYAYLYTV